MHRPMPPVLLVVLILCGAVLLSMDGCGGGGDLSPPPPPPGKIEHVVVIFQENRTPDNMFQDPVLIKNGADIVQSGLNSLGQTIPLTPISLANSYDLDHSHDAFVAMYDNGKMDGADKIKCRLSCPAANPQFMYVNPQDVQPYFAMAEQYSFGDHMFQTNQGPSFPAHQFIIAGTSAPTATSTSFAAENMNAIGGAGCISPPTMTVNMINALGVQSGSQFPCFEHPTLIDGLDAKGISWRYYTIQTGVNAALWNGPDAIQHLCQPQMQNGTLVCSAPDWTKVTTNNTQVLTDIANKQLPQVSWVIPDGKNSDHPASNDGSGPSWVASIVNAIGNSAYWSNTAIIITWDDWGGWYDHVAPKVITDGTSWGSGYVYGFRVPLLVVSPYAKPGYISHATHDFGSILKFIEETFGLSNLGYADARADDLSDCFNLSQTPIKFQTIAAPLSAQDFLNDTRPPVAPDND